MSNVSLYVVDLKRVQPFMMNTPRVTTVVNTGVNDLPKTSGKFEIKVLDPSKKELKNKKDLKNFVIFQMSLLNQHCPLKL